MANRGLWSLITRTAALAILGAVCGAACVALAYTRQPGIVWRMDRNKPEIASGFYPVESQEAEPFAWTAARATLTLGGLDRRRPWQCTVRLRGARPPSAPQPLAQILIDGAPLASRTPSGAYEEVTVEAPIRPANPRLSLTIATAPTFVPGPADRRELGVQVARVDCQPIGGSLSMPPRAATIAAATALGALGAAAGALGLPFFAASLGLIGLAAAQGAAFGSGAALYSDAYAGIVARSAISIALTLVLGAAAVPLLRRTPLSATARVAMVFSGGVLFIKLVALLHPSKAPADAVFHAHRLDWVLAGRYFFTQPLPDGVQFPYAIALYVVASPWAGLVRNHVALLWSVVCVVDAVAALLLYPAASRAWGDRRVGVAAVVLWHTVPLPYIVIGNANLTFAFGAAAALMTMAAAALAPLWTRRLTQLVSVFTLASIAFLSHVAVFPFVFVALLLVALFYAWHRERAWRTAALSVAGATVLAAIFSITAYYGHFSAVYRTFERVGVHPSSAVAPGRLSVATTDRLPRISATEPVSRARRAVHAASLIVRALGWPTLVLLSGGAWAVWRSREPDHLRTLLGAWCLTYGVFVGFAVLAPVEPGFQRYTDEFIDRLNYLVAPAVVLLASRGVSWAWHGRGLVRAALAAVLLSACYGAALAWQAWLS